MPQGRHAPDRRVAPRRAVLVLSLSCDARLRPGYPQQYCTLRMPVASAGVAVPPVVPAGEEPRNFGLARDKQLAGGQPPGPARRLRAEARHLPVVVPVASWRIQRIRSAAAWGWSPNSRAIRPAQPRVPSRRTVRLIASVTLSAVGTSDRCSSEANRASHRAPSTFNRVITPPLVSRLKRLTGPTLPRQVSLVKRLTFAKLRA